MRKKRQKHSRNTPETAQKIRNPSNQLVVKKLEKIRKNQKKSERNQKKSKKRQKQKKKFKFLNFRFLDF